MTAVEAALTLGQAFPRNRRGEDAEQIERRAPGEDLHHTQG